MFSDLCIVIDTREKNQQDAHIFLIIYVKLLTCFKQITVHHQEVCLYIVHLENIHRPTALEYIFPLLLL
jgi:hypothetical protein